MYSWLFSRLKLIIVGAKVANTGVTEVGQFTQVSFDSNGKPVKPDLTTLDVNLVGILHGKRICRLHMHILISPFTLAVHLAQYYLARKRQPNDLKALVVLGSMGK